MPVDPDDPWVQTIRLLSSERPCPCVVVDTTRATKHATLYGPETMSNTDSLPRLAVSLIERTTPFTVTIAWRDATSCFYGAQIWRVANAKVSGICALSGQRIRRGDRILRPQRSRRAPVNARAMILESVLNTIEPLQTSQV